LAFVAAVEPTDLVKGGPMPRLRPALAAAPAIVVTLYALAAGAETGASFHGDTHRYTLRVPDGWTPVPRQVIDTIMKVTASPQSQGKIVFDAGFQRADASHDLAYPYVLVQVMPYKAMGVRRQPTEADIREVARQVTGMKVDDAIDDALTPQAKGMVRNPEVGKVVVDMPRRAYRFNMQMAVAGVGPVKGYMAGYFGRNALIQVMYYERADDPAPREADRQAFLNSFKFDPAAAYDETQSQFSGVWGGALISVVVAVVIAGYWASKNRNPTPTA
jgi:hypothetical protein